MRFKFKRQRFWGRLLILAITSLILAVFGTHTFAQDAAPTADDILTLKISVDTTWVLLTGFLVFFMQLRCQPRAVDLPKLQKLLLKQGAYLG